MAISRDVSTNEQDKFVESTATTGQVGVAVVNPDGSSISGGAGGTQYTEGDTDASITGTAVMWEDTSDTLRAASAAKPLPVDVKSVAPGTYAVDDSAMPATPQTVPVSGEYRSSATTYGDGDVTVLQTDVNGNLKTTLATGLSSADDTVGVRPDDYATDDSAMPATPRVVPVGGEARDTANSYADGDAVVQQFNRAGALVNAGLDNFYVTKCAPSAFDGATTNARGDEGGTSDPFTLFTVTGDVLIGVYGVCTTDLVGSGTVSVGPTGNATLMLAALAATSIDQNEVWMDATPAIGKPIDSLNYYVVGNGVDIVEDIATDTVTAGNIYYVALWKPLTPGSNVVSAV